MATELQKKNRKVLRTAVTRSANEVQNLLDANTVVVLELQAAYEMLVQKYDDMRVSDNEIYAALLTADAEERVLATELDECDTYIKRFTLLKLRCEKLLQEDQVSAVSAVGTHTNTSVSRAHSNQQTGRRTFKLPVIEFKKFDGQIKDWLPFWTQFKTVHDDAEIEEHDKIEYLRQATVPGSRARQLVDSFPAIAGNYEKIVESLQTRYGREDLQIEVYVRGLLRHILINATSPNRIDISVLYDEIETQLRALATLGVTSDKCSAMLFPLIESCLPEDLLRVWQRSPNAIANVADNVSTLEDRLQKLMDFLKGEVENEMRISLASEGFGIRSMANSSQIEGDKRVDKRKQAESKRVSNTPTAAGLLNSVMDKCLFCAGAHETTTCFKAQKMSMEQKRKILSEKKACYRCTKMGHQSKRCNNRLRCILCDKSHVVLMCPNLSERQQQSASSPSEVKPEVINVARKPPDPVSSSLSSHSVNDVLLQTLMVEVETADGRFPIRALIDSGSQRSYILKSIAQALGCEPKRKETISHGLFGGSRMTQTHNCYDVKLVRDSRSYVLEVLDQPMICQGISSAMCGPWIDELKTLGIQIRDDDFSTPIGLLFGADFAGTLYTGQKRILESGLVAMETVLGWTLLGKSRVTASQSNTAFIGLVKDVPIAALWDLDVLGIMDPIEKKSRDECTLDAQKFFADTITLNDEGRYEVRLPWLPDHPPLPTNFELARKRLQNTVKKLQELKLHEAYDAIFKQWLAEGIIELVDESEVREGHYMPHRAVIREHSTTPIRPVFDASARTKDGPSLNLCLEKGANLIELIPSVIQRFREFKIGVISDIRKAFLQISVCKEDRNVLKFLWIEPDGTSRTYRHRRVVFGINSSPFLLGATIKFHLQKSLEKSALSNTPYTQETLLRLQRSFYVDNCSTSLPDESALIQFINEATLVMDEAKFDLRGWESTGSAGRESEIVSVLGLNWHLGKDVLTINTSVLQEAMNLEGKITKRKMLSITQQLFDPIGFICPAIILPKLLLQQLWERQCSWDEVVDEETQAIFQKWVSELPSLIAIEVPRWVGFTLDSQNWALHTFCDASEKAYSAVVFLRIVEGDRVIVRLLAAKSRIAPLKKISIPRLELLAATIGARLCANVKSTCSGEAHCYFWSDSTTVISWIRRTEEWSVFVRNRIAEIRRLTSPESWRHVPGVNNPADLPSRGCSPKQLLVSRWWEGPDWLQQKEEMWPQEAAELNETEIDRERLKKVVTSMVNHSLSQEWHLTYFSKYMKIVRMVGWCFRVAFNIKHRHQRRSGGLLVEEIDIAEMFVLKIIQDESFSGENAKKLNTLKTFRDKTGLLRVQTQVSNRQDQHDFRFPVVLPAKHVIVERLIFDRHVTSCHIGLQGLMSLLRERYWILGGRRSIRSVISRCVTCRRHNAKPFAVETPPLLEDRVRDAVVFEVTGVDFAGPLYMKNEGKAWICLFTCAVYRAVHLELVTSLTTSGFIQALRRFVARRGRPRTIYSDNGTNFVGAENLFMNLDWDAITQYTSTQRISWKFNPPSAPWWGGFWERLIGLLKQLLRRVLGRASLTFEDMCTVLCDCESVINSRPLTYVSANPGDFVALTPAMFLHEQVEHGVPDLDAVDEEAFSRKIRYLQKIRRDLRSRFRNEYLGVLPLISGKCSSRPIRVGEIVLIGTDVGKRSDWPLGRVVETISGRDGNVRLARVDTAKGQLLRPIQRLYPLEGISFEPVSNAASEGDCAFAKEEREGVREKIQESEDVQPVDNRDSAVVSDVDSSIHGRAPETKVSVSRSGRVLRRPKRYLD